MNRSLIRLGRVRVSASNAATAAVAAEPGDAGLVRLPPGDTDPDGVRTVSCWSGASADVTTQPPVVAPGGSSANSWRPG